MDHDVFAIPDGFFDEGPVEGSDRTPDDGGTSSPATPAQPVGGQYVNIDGEDIWIPDEDFPAPPPAPPLAGPLPVQQDHDTGVLPDAEFAAALDRQENTVTADTCLQRVLEIFPDVCHEHVTKLFNDFNVSGDYETVPGQARLDNIIEQLVSSGGSYPKHDKGKHKKRKREDSVDVSSDLKRWEAEDREIAPHFLKGSEKAMLKAEFPGESIFITLS
jgi:E3 ubiquitin-protein ligase RNF216